MKVNLDFLAPELLCGTMFRMYHGCMYLTADLYIHFDKNMLLFESASTAVLSLGYFSDQLSLLSCESHILTAVSLHYL